MDTFEDNRREKPSKVFIPTRTELDNTDVKYWSSMLLRIIAVNVDMRKCDYFDHLDRLKPFFNGSFYTTTDGKITLRGLNCSEEMVSEESSCEAYWLDSSGVARGLGEAKNSTDAPVEGTRQAVSEAINMAIAQVKLGVAPEDILIPIFSTTGHI